MSLLNNKLINIVKKYRFYFFNLIIGFFLGLFAHASSIGRNILGLSLSDIITTIFTAFLIYFSYLQSKFINFQYNLSLERSAPSLVLELDNINKNLFYIKNMGERSAYKIECAMFNYTNGEEHIIEEIDEIYSKGIRREYFPDWKEEGISVIDVVMSYYDEETGGTRRYYSDTIQIEFEKTQIDPSDYLDIV